ncbi:hypothetical protein [Teredinibacter franksiae]|uniref:hypothetical protein n=1 Tax=Teredinibacter franksiae TaxID=2761453 RepID=UPI0016244172|nr:hypothetical protein [Teredinibacter franksiae]
MSYRVISLIALMGVLFGCGGESSKNSEYEIIELELVDDCVNASPNYPQALNKASMDYGDGSDGELYLAHGDIFELEEKIYNFVNINLDQGSLMTISDEIFEGDGSIQINSLGVCNLLGEIDNSDYRGSLTINCYGDFFWASTYRGPPGSSTVIDGSGPQVYVSPSSQDRLDNTMSSGLSSVEIFIAQAASTGTIVGSSDTIVGKALSHGEGDGITSINEGVATITQGNIFEFSTISTPFVTTADGEHTLEIEFNDLTETATISIPSNTVTEEYTFELEDSITRLNCEKISH